MGKATFCVVQRVGAGHMCGIAGIFNLRENRLPEFDAHKVLETLFHRGPDDEGVFRNGGIFLGARRLAIIDPGFGAQPVSDETGRFHLVMNGEIYDYDLLLDELRSRGHRFRSHCDTEVAVHLFEEEWCGALERIDGQFAIAVHDAREHELLLARDRMGISPLFYAQAGDYLVFASEMKAIFATGLLKPAINPRSLDAILAFGCVPAPGTIFEGIKALFPGRYLRVKDGVISEHTFWDIDFPDAGDYPLKSERQLTDEFREILYDACRRRLKADVPVGIYLSGGIDSSSVAAMVKDTDGINGRVFSIGFPEPAFDESNLTKNIAQFLGLETHILTYHQRELCRDFPRLIYHSETPLIATEAVALMALSGLASKHVKVVLTGEGSDEALGGYAYFRWEMYKKRCKGLWGKIALLLAEKKFQRIVGQRNPFFPKPEDAAWAEEVFGFYPAEMMNFFYFRTIRGLVYSDEMMERQRHLSDADFLDLPRERMRRWDQLNRSLYVSSRGLMTNHILGAHGDRALMANSVEGRYPFLDRRVQEFLATVPPEMKTRANNDKYLLRRTMEGMLPKDVLRRGKKMFLAPFGTPFVGDDASDYVKSLLLPEMISEFGYFDPDKVRGIVKGLEKIKESLAKDGDESLPLDRKVFERTLLGMALTFVVSTQVLADLVRSGKFNGVCAARALKKRQIDVLHNPSPLTQGTRF